MWTDKQMTDFFNKFKNWFPKFIDDTKLGFLFFMSVFGLIFLLFIKLIFNYIGIEYHFWYGMLGLMTTALLYTFFDSIHKDKKWW